MAEAYLEANVSQRKKHLKMFKTKQAEKVFTKKCKEP